MKLRLVDLLACPACGDGAFDLAIDRATDRPIWDAHIEPGEAVAGASGGRITEVEAGSLTCRECGVRFPIVAGIPRLLPPGAPGAPGTGHRLTEFDVSAPEYEENFRDLLDPVEPEAFMGRLVVDAGCGFGRHARFAARYGAEVVALDASEEAVLAASRNLQDSVRAHVVLGDVHRPPLKKSAFDIVYSFGVLHHVTDPPVAFAALNELVRPGGRLSVWVYGPRQGLTRIATGALRGATAQMSSDQLLHTSRALASILRVFSHTPHRFLGAVPVLSSLVTHLPVHDHSRWPFDVVVADVYDRLRIPVTAYFRGEDLERWYADAAYADIQVTRRVRNTESFRGTGIRR
jgi:SAM-dependent methyltransferase